MNVKVLMFTSKKSCLFALHSQIFPNRSIRYEYNPYIWVAFGLELVLVVARLLGGFRLFHLYVEHDLPLY